VALTEQTQEFGALMKRNVVVVAAALAALVATPSCGGGKSLADDVLRGVRSQSDDAANLGKSKWVPRNFEPPPKPPSQDEIAAQGERILQPATEVPPEQQKAVIKAACEAAEIFDLESEEEASNYLKGKTSIAVEHATQAVELWRNLVDAKTSSEQAEVLSQAAVCQWASS
jgi:hypothetical protein